MVRGENVAPSMLRRVGEVLDLVERALVVVEDGDSPAIRIAARASTRPDEHRVKR